jgi:hypothetical protein
MTQLTDNGVCMNPVLHAVVLYSVATAVPAAVERFPRGSTTSVRFFNVPILFAATAISGADVLKLANVTEVKEVLAIILPTVPWAVMTSPFDENANLVVD